MGIFDFLFKKKNETTADKQLLEPVNITEEITLPRVLANHWQDIQKTGLPFVSIKAIPQEHLTLEQSKFGHYPCIPEDFPYPTGPDGDFLYPLAQINFSEFASLPGYPATGYLQFYIAADDQYGLDFDNVQTQTSFRVLFFEEEAVQNKRTDFSFLDEIMESDAVPVLKPYALAFITKTDYIGLSDFRSSNSPYFNRDAIVKDNPTISAKLIRAMYEQFSSAGHKIGGYASFTQDDPRRFNDAFKDYILLLQIDSDDEITWGDVGVANFFIHPDDLAKKDFSKVLYNWDCH